MKDLILRAVNEKKTAILGFGREGRSTFRLLRSYYPELPIAVVDSNPALAVDPLLSADPLISLRLGEGCMNQLNDFDLIIKAPGIPAHAFPEGTDLTKITSQTSLFLQHFGSQVIGVTGTKGKSTTSSLIHHVLSSAGQHSLLVGNIGVPPFDCIPEIKRETIVVMELSSHQLEYLVRSPHIALLLNIFQEHLDHYTSYQDYQKAKLNIGRFQSAGDYFIYGSDNALLNSLVAGGQLPGQQLLPFSLQALEGDGIFRKGKKVMLRISGTEKLLFDASAGILLPGEHNFSNCMAAAAACYLSGTTAELTGKGISSFTGLEHRIEYVGEYNGIKFYNDSIATIPEATIEAVKTLKTVDTLILGGFDRGIDYSILYPFLIASEIRNLIFIGEAGARMKNEVLAYPLAAFSQYTATDYAEVVAIAKKVSLHGKICLLSPAAASYDMFKNFEHRGNIYKKNVRNDCSPQK